MKKEESSPGKPNAPLGYCPKCGAKGKFRERRLGGNDVCEERHVYPSTEAVTAQGKTSRKKELQEIRQLCVKSAVNLATSEEWEELVKILGVEREKLSALYLTGVCKGITLGLEKNG